MTGAVLPLVLLVVPAVGPPKDEVVGSGNNVTEKRQLQEFDEIEFRIAGNFTVTVDDEPTPLEIDTDDNILPLITTKVVDGRLIVDSKKPFKTKHEPDLKVAVTSLKRVTIMGSGDMMAKGLDNNKFHAEINGSADLRLYGKTDRLVVEVNGSGDVFAFELAAQQVDISINGSGDVRVSAAESLAVSIAGSGDVRYKGEPAVQQKIIGSGDVHRHRTKPQEQGH